MTLPPWAADLARGAGVFEPGSPAPGLSALQTPEYEYVVGRGVATLPGQIVPEGE